MLDIGFAELLLLSVVGLLVLGPERLPKVARTLGGLARKARSSWSNLKRSIESEMHAEELKKPFEDIKKAKDEIAQPVEDLKKPFEDFQRDLQASARKFQDKANESVDGDSRPDSESPNESPDELSGQSNDTPGGDTTAEASASDAPDDDSPKAVEAAGDRKQ
jgi:sec-independent protein translocase protein TatB